MVLATDPSGRFAYVPKADRSLPPDQQTTFWLRVLTVREREGLVSLQGSVGIKEPARFLHIALRVGLDGWSGFRSSSGQEITCELAPRSDISFSSRAQYVTDAALERIPFGLMDELAMAILVQNSLCETDAKN